MDNSTIKKILAGLDSEFIKNYTPPKNRSELTEEEELTEEVNFFSVESFKIGLRLGAEVFSEKQD